MMCEWCGEPNAEIPVNAIGMVGTSTVYYHVECQIRQVTGGLKHHRRECHCYNRSADNEPPNGMTLHEESFEVRRLVDGGDWNYG